MINFIRREIYADFALPQLELFLLVVENDGISETELSQILDMPQPTVTRNVKKLCFNVVKLHDGSYEKVGYGLLKNRPNDVESRRFNVFLTSEGNELAKSLKLI